MKAVILIVLTFSLLNLSNAQDYFQQKVDYALEVVLHDSVQEVSADFTIVYHNNSPDVLTYLIFHLWPNAYRSKNSEFARQEADMGSRDFYFAKPDEMGGYTDLSLRVDGVKLNIKEMDGHQDVVMVDLPVKLQPGKKISLTGSFRLDMPDGFSRLGKQNGAYQLTQWYPKPAVYDQKGWHPMPYIAMGEFYSEFGDYLVRLTCPDKYVIASTGTIRSAQEVVRYNEMASGGGAYPSSGQMKTIEIEATNVHDFAIFLDDGFFIEKEMAYLNEGRDSIPCWGYYHRKGSTWQQSAFYVKRAIEFLSAHAGTYPWPQASAVEGLIAAGGGMEYPMVTIIDPIDDPATLDGIIAHEVAHNWFYGLMASNERDHPWMDEGLTSYYEERYRRTYYPDGGDMPLVMQKILGGNTNELLYQFQARRGMEKAGCCSREYSPVNYQLGAYSKPTLVYEYLEDLYGQSTVDAATQNYFAKWAFKHPQPDDLKAAFEHSLGTDLYWLFDDLLQSTRHLDYAVKRGRNKNDVIVQNKGEIAAPYRLEGVKGDSVFEGHMGERALVMSGDTAEIQLDRNGKSLDINYFNNSLSKGRSLLPRVHLLPGAHYKERSLYLHPIMGWNNYDKYMLGLRVSNTSLLPQRLVYNFNPMFGFGSQDVIGFGDVHYNHFSHESSVRLWQIGAAYKRYNVSESPLDGDLYAIEKWSPYIRFFFGENETTGVAQSISAGYDLIKSEVLVIGIDGSLNKVIDDFDRYALSYHWKKEGGIHPMTLNVAAEYGQYEIPVGRAQDYLRTELEFEVDMYYNEKSKINIRTYLGYFPINSRREAGSVSSPLARRSFGLAYQGYHDYLDHTFLGRSEQDGFLARQVAIREGGFKTALTSSMAMVIGNSNHAIASLNLQADLPWQWWPAKWVKPFLDIGYYADRLPTSDKSSEEQLLWSGGISLSAFKGLLAVHFPLVQSSNINDAFEQAGLDKLGSRISFSLDIDKLRLIDFVESRQIRVQI